MKQNKRLGGTGPAPWCNRQHRTGIGPETRDGESGGLIDRIGDR